MCSSDLFGEPLLESEAIVIKRKGVEVRTEVSTLIRRLQGVVIARQYVLVDYDVESKNLEAACAITPGL